MAVKAEKKRNPVAVEKPLIPTPVRPDEEKSFLPMVHGTATDALATMAGEKLEPNTLNHTASATSRGVRLVIEQQIEKLTTTWGVGAHKIFSKGITEFTAANHTGENKRELRELGVSFSLKDYALKCGYDVVEHEKATPEEQKAEAARAKTELDNARRSIKKDLDLLYRSSISWSEKIKGRPKDFMDIRLISSKGIRKGRIYLAFTQEMGEYLIQLPLTEYPDALYLVDGRKPNVYNMGLKMSENFSNYNNLLQHQAKLLSVKSLLACTDLPTPEKLAKNRLSWEARIKEPFETILDELSNYGLLEDWYYSHSKEVRLTYEEASNFSSYEEWASTLVCFTLKNAPDHTARLEAIAEKRKQAQTKKKKASKKGKASGKAGAGENKAK